ncbi:MAG: hypothetical protein SWX82_02775 [Cyanobacteriota bacterium]|nr:hypothetical protein [Cyanobacteriota bacterium]
MENKTSLLYIDLVKVSSIVFALLILNPLVYRRGEWHSPSYIPIAIHAHL